MPRKSKTVLVVRKGRYVAISREIFEYNQRKKAERKLEREKNGKSEKESKWNEK